jgi:uncharacterized protein YdbL (DUF1318 family)
VFQPNSTLFNVTLSNPTSGATLVSPSTAAVTIAESDQQGTGTIQFVQPNYTVPEMGGTATITLTRSGALGAATVDFATSDGSAVKGTNYVATSGTVTFAANQQTATFPVKILDDGVFQATNSTLNLTLSAATGAGSLGTQNTATLTIIEGDGPTIVATPNQVFVAHAYIDLLGRAVDPGGLNTWVGLLNSGGSRMQVAVGIESTQEFRTAEVQSLYSIYLHRAADAAGITNFTNLLAAGGTLEQVATGLVGSPEYFQSRAGGTNDGFLNALYLDALGRGVDAAGRASFDAALANGVSTAQVAASIFASIEYHQVLVQGYYLKYLHRPADAVGLNSLVQRMTVPGVQPIFVSDPSQLNQPLRDEDVIALFIASDEYFVRNP